MSQFNLPVTVSDNIISVRNLTKQYEMGGNPIQKLRKTLFGSSRVSKISPDKQMLALNDISFDLEKGSSLGILGLNGSGKSTLLQIIANTLKPSSGTVKVKGKVSALLELGSGFNPDFTGRENSLLNGALIGNSTSETIQKLPEIESFAEIGKFFDMPVRTYSSGMQLRLAFAVATSYQPDILIVDEALAVGDAYFQAKCFERISQFKKNGMSLILVTHSVEDVPKNCDKALMLMKGKLFASGKPKEITNLYLENLHKPTHEIAKLDDAGETYPSFDVENFDKRPFYRKEEHRWGNEKARILDYIIKNEKNELFPNKINSSDRLTISFSVTFHSFAENVIPGLLVKSIDGNFLYGTNNLYASGNRDTISVKKGDSYTFSFEIKLTLNSGSYLISLGVSSQESNEFVPMDRRYDSILLKVYCRNKVWGIVDLEAKFQNNQK
jgi:lipopolysaccharide transport system ATP-binding protein